MASLPNPATGSRAAAIGEPAPAGEVSPERQLSGEAECGTAIIIALVVLAILAAAANLCMAAEDAIDQAITITTSELWPNVPLNAAEFQDLQAASIAVGVLHRALNEIPAKMPPEAREARAKIRRDLDRAKSILIFRDRSRGGDDPGLARGCKISMSDRVNRVIVELHNLRNAVFETGDLAACCWLYEILNQLCSDFAVMKSAWLPQDIDKAEVGAELPELPELPNDDLSGAEPDLEIVRPLELEKRIEPSEPKIDFTEGE